MIDLVLLYLFMFYVRMQSVAQTIKCRAIIYTLHIIVQGYSKRSTHFQKFILQKLLTLNPCPVYGWKGNLSKFWTESPARYARNNSVYQRVFKMAASVQEKAFCVLEFGKTTSVSSVQRHFRTRYRKNPPTRKSIYDWCKCGKSWIIDLTSATSLVGLTSSDCKVWK
jgi:hypothetical protein